ncbi:60S ribosomal protein L6, partial [Galemys pyrenaicus]
EKAQKLTSKEKKAEATKTHAGDKVKRSLKTKEEDPPPQLKPCPRMRIGRYPQSAMYPRKLKHKYSEAKFRFEMKKEALILCKSLIFLRHLKSGLLFVTGTLSFNKVFLHITHQKFISTISTKLISDMKELGKSRHQVGKTFAKKEQYRVIANHKVDRKAVVSQILPKFKAIFQYQ